MTQDIEMPINFVFNHPLGHYSIVIRQYLLGQWRLQLMENNPATYDDFPIVRECCTYKRETAVKVKDGILASLSPLQYLESLAKPWNCEYPGGRIRLDNEQPSI